MLLLAEASLGLLFPQHHVLNVGRLLHILRSMRRVIVEFVPREEVRIAGRGTNHVGLLGSLRVFMYAAGDVVLGA